MNTISKEKVVAEAAVRPYEAEHYLDLHSQIAATTGLPLAEVEQMIHELIVEKTLTVRIEPMLNPRPKPILESWYEEGDGWDLPGSPETS